MLSRLQRMARIKARSRDQQPRLEALERRALLTTFTVSNTSDSGTGSLRAAINSANLDTATTGVDTINFAIPGTGVHTIALQAALPTISRPIKIDGTTQTPTSAAQRTPTIVIDGANAGTGANGLTLQGTGGSTIDDLAIVNFASSLNNSGRGILVLDGGGDTFTENYLGIDPDGSTAKPNVVGIELKSANNVVGATQTGASTDAPNLISGNTSAGVLIDGSGATKNQVIGNEIGTDSTRTRSVANLIGVQIASASNNTIGGTNLTMHSLGNLISGNNVAPTYNIGVGVNISGTSSGNIIAGNLIGTDGTGSKALTNIYGIYLGTVGATSSTVDSITNTTIGGTVAGSGNTISGNGLGIFGNVASSLIAGNQIGGTATGSGTIGNGYGIFLGATGTTIGGTTAAARNTITGSGLIGTGGIGLSLSGDTDTVAGNTITANQLGIELHTTKSTIGGTATGAGNSITGNSGDGIDIDANPGNTVQGNTITNSGSGINVILPAPGTTSTTTPFALADEIGGTATGAANIITGNKGAGVSLTSNGSLATGLTIQGNQINSNGALGINLNGTSSTPIAGTLAITSANTTSAGSLIYGLVNGTPGQTVTVDLYNNAVADPSGFGEGQTYLGSIAVIVGPGGLTAFNKTFTTPIGTQPIITATSTDATGSTSEFSAAFSNTGPAPTTDLALSQVISSSSVTTGGLITLTSTVINNGTTTARGVVFTDNLATSLNNATIKTSVGTAAVDGSNNAVAQLGDLAAGASATITITANTSANGVISNTMGVVGTTPETTYSNNLSTQSFTVGNAAKPMADLAITVSPSTTTPTVGANLTYTVTVTNNGPQDASAVTINDFLPLNSSTFVSAVPSQGPAATVNGNLVTDVIGSIASGKSATLVITATPTAVGTFSNTANVSGAQLDPINTNNSATSALTVPAPGAPTLALTQSVAPAGPGQVLTLTVQNTGTVPALGVIVVDQLPTGVTYISALPSQGAAATISNNEVSSNLGYIAPGASATLMIAIVPTSTTNLSNLAGVIAAGNTGAIPIFSQGTLGTTTTTAGPAVSSVVGSRSNAQLVVNFSAPITAASATNRANYRLYALGSTPRAITSSDRAIAFTTAVYNSTSNSVTLTPSRAINATQYYALVVVGNTTAGITDTSGRKLVGVAGGTAGTNFSATFLAGQLTQV